MSKIVQTLWTGQKSLVADRFGWLNPQYHLMAWALSSLLLRDNYEDVELYTDTSGAAMLAERIGLPYTKVHVCFDSLRIPEALWAYPKVLTYSMQKEPFVHVDGDVFMSGKLPVDIDNTGLIMQNEESGTCYYKRMMDALVPDNMNLPACLRIELSKQSIGSYNAGIIGGADIDFIHRYCDNVFDIVRDNRLDDVNEKRISVNHNLMFEQVLFYAMAEQEHKSVATVFERVMNDNGYTYDGFCDFRKLDRQPLLHQLGGHKRNAKACILLGKTLLDRYPDYFWKIVEIVNNGRVRLSGYLKSDTSEMSVEMCVARYRDWLKSFIGSWDGISADELKRQEENASHAMRFFNMDDEYRKMCILAINPYLTIFSIPADWPSDAKRLLLTRLYEKDFRNKSDIACIPTLFGMGYKEVPVNDLCYNILQLFHREQSFEQLCERIMLCVSEKSGADRTHIYNRISEAVEMLMTAGLIYVNTEGVTDAIDVA